MLLQNKAPITIETWCKQEKKVKGAEPEYTYYSHIVGNIVPRAQTATIEELFVTDMMRNVGIGKQLVESFIALARVHSPMLSVVMVESLPESKLFYMKLGFKVVLMKSDTVMMKKTIARTA